jgi:hypothetical protein
VKLRLVISCFSLVLLSGCARYVNWGRSQFEQVTYRVVHERDFDPYIQSIDRYDGFNTVGHFDLVWYAYPVLEWFFKQYGERVGASSAAWKKLYNEQMLEQRQRIVFYIALPYNSNSLVAQLSLEKSDLALWSARLYIDGIEHQPVEIRKISRPIIELAHIFGPRYDAHYRELYYVAYARSSQDTNDYLANAQALCLVLRSDVYEVVASWTPQCLERHRRIEEPLQ